MPSFKFILNWPKHFWSSHYPSLRDACYVHSCICMLPEPNHKSPNHCSGLTILSQPPPEALGINACLVASHNALSFLL
ncbi:hypothetical protein HZ326_23195 [Fusarium oxysporum f. sp. albedinis]|nr:hypothetical protein HZ326_23195 [Fusarium oxysporum f. sp. albedinis]